jgi:hypothetical protein
MVRAGWSWVCHRPRSTIAGVSTSSNAASSSGNMKVLTCLERDPGSNIRP